MRLTLINPNTNATTTEEMVSIAAAACPSAQIFGLTAPFGAALITCPDELATAARAVASLAPDLGVTDGVIIAAFGDPGLADLRALVNRPVTGIAEAGMAEAARDGRRFAVVTTTPNLVAQISACARIYDHTGYIGAWLTEGDPVIVMGDPVALVAALSDACHRAMLEGAEAIVIGGGPLAQAARSLARSVPVPLVEPVPAAVRLAIARSNSGGLP